MRLLLLLGLMLGVLNAESRYALLIGNSDYKYIDDLKDPSYDIGRLKKSLEDLNFKVKIEKNLNSEYLSEAIEQFSKRLSRDKNNIGFLYYSGHGCQLNYQGYLVPTDVDTKNKVKIKHHALSINEMLDTLSIANNRVNMFFLDACRDVPTGAKGGKKGLGQPTTTPKGFLVVYATEAGKTADDNSNFINALIENIKQPNQTVKDMADNISNTVADKTEEKQIPVIFYKRLPEGIVLNNGYISSSEPVYVPVLVPPVPQNIYIPTTLTSKPPSLKPLPSSLYNLERPQDKPVKGIITINGKLWQDESINETKRLPYDKAKDYCESIMLGGYKNWRLPSLIELEELYKYKNKLKYVDTDYFTYSNVYHASASSDSSTTTGINFYDGSDYLLFRYPRKVNRQYNNGYSSFPSYSKVTVGPSHAYYRCIKEKEKTPMQAF